MQDFLKKMQDLALDMQNILNDPKWNTTTVHPAQLSHILESRANLLNAQKKLNKLISLVNTEYNKQLGK